LAHQIRIMKKTLPNIILTFLLFLVSTAAQAENTDFIRSTGKIYVVVALIASVFIGIVFFMVYLERKLTNLENQIKDNE